MKTVNLKKIYFLYYVYEFEDGHDDIRLLGVFSSKEKANIALKNIKKNPNYKKIKNLFSIHQIIIDKLGWTEGYVRVY